jgi:hypothetical protein
MASLKQQDRKAYGEIQKFFREQLETNAGLGYPLRGEWSGYRAIHVYNDLYRVIWRDLPEIEDYSGGEDDTVVSVEVVRVGLKTQSAEGPSMRSRPTEDAAYAALWMWQTATG